jgi:hypothetical protein
VRVSTSRRKNEQRINIKFCMKLGKNASDTCAMLSEAYEGESMKSLSVPSDINGSKVARTLKSQIKKIFIPFFDIKNTQPIPLTWLQMTSVCF